METRVTRLSIDALRNAKTTPRCYACFSGINPIQTRRGCALRCVRPAVCVRTCQLPTAYACARLTRTSREVDNARTRTRLCLPAWCAVCMSQLDQIRVQRLCCCLCFGCGVGAGEGRMHCALCEKFVGFKFQNLQLCDAALLFED